METSLVKALSVLRVKSLARISQRVALTSFILLTCICLPGCIPLAVPIKVSNHNIGASGERNRKVDLTFLMAGTTRRPEVDEKLGWLDTGFKNQKLYWGRYSEVTSKVVSLGNGTDNWHDAYNWHERNLMIELGENDIVKQWEILDDKHLGAWLLTWATRTKQPPFDPASPTNCAPVDCRQIKKVRFGPAWVGDQTRPVYPRDPDPAHFQAFLELKKEFVYIPPATNSAPAVQNLHASKYLGLRVDAATVYAFIRAQNLVS